MHSLDTTVTDVSIMCLYYSMNIWVCEYPKVGNSLYLLRLLILGSPKISKIKTTTFPKEERFQSSGQLQRPFTFASTPLPVMSGAMAASSMRYGHWDTNHLACLPTRRLVVHPLFFIFL